jgi:hypothetical protein
VPSHPEGYSAPTGAGLQRVGAACTGLQTAKRGKIRCDWVAPSRPSIRRPNSSSQCHHNAPLFPWRPGGLRPMSPRRLFSTDTGGEPHQSITGKPPRIRRSNCSAISSSSLSPRPSSPAATGGPALAGPAPALPGTGRAGAAGSPPQPLSEAACQQLHGAP